MAETLWKIALEVKQTSVRLPSISNMKVQPTVVVRCALHDCLLDCQGSCSGVWGSSSLYFCFFSTSTPLQVLFFFY